MNEHPEELLADYVDGTLEPDQRAGVEAHLASCSVCREEVALAAGTLEALGALPELPAPAGLGGEVVPLAPRRRLVPPRLAWAGAGVAAAAAVVVAAFVFLGQGGRELEEQAGGEAPEAEAPGTPQPAPVEAPAAEVDESLARTAAYPIYLETGQEYAPTTLSKLTARVKREAQRALEAGFPPTAREFYARVDLRDLPKDTRSALECVVTGAQPDRTFVPFVLEAARFEGSPVYAGAFLQGPDEDAPYDRVVVWVVSREGCQVRSFARQKL